MVFTFLGKVPYRDTFTFSWFQVNQLQINHTLTPDSTLHNPNPDIHLAFQSLNLVKLNIWKKNSRKDKYKKENINSKLNSSRDTKFFNLNRWRDLLCGTSSQLMQNRRNAMEKKKRKKRPQKWEDFGGGGGAASCHQLPPSRSYKFTILYFSGVLNTIPTSTSNHQFFFFF